MQNQLHQPTASHPVSRHTIPLRILVLTSLFAIAVSTSSAQQNPPARPTPASQQIVNTMVGNEASAADHRGHYFYLSEERSDRTGGHLWQERIAETNWGKVRYLIAEDGHAITGDRLGAERARVAGEASDPEAFRRSEQARVDDEQHAKQMLELLPKGFLFDPATMQGDLFRIAFRPNPDYSPQTLEERVIHGMSGFILIDRKQLRLHEVQGRLQSDVNIGFGFLATIHAGSNFSSIRIPLEGIDWKTQALHTDINGRALFLKTIARQQESHHTGFQKIPDTMSVADAVTMLERDPAGEAPRSR